MGLHQHQSGHEQQVSQQAQHQLEQEQLEQQSAPEAQAQVPLSQPLLSQPAGEAAAAPQAAQAAAAQALPAALAAVLAAHPGPQAQAAPSLLAASAAATAASVAAHGIVELPDGLPGASSGAGPKYKRGRGRSFFKGGLLFPSGAFVRACFDVGWLTGLGGAQRVLTDRCATAGAGPRQGASAGAQASPPMQSLPAAAVFALFPNSACRASKGVGVPGARLRPRAAQGSSVLQGEHSAVSCLAAATCHRPPPCSRNGCTHVCAACCLRHAEAQTRCLASCAMQHYTRPAAAHSLTMALSFTLF